MEVNFFIGKALDTLLDDTTMELRVFVHDLAPFAVGDLSLQQRLKIMLNNIQEQKQIDTHVEISNFVYATYLGSVLGGKRPNIHQKEAVALFSFGGDSTLYWVPIGNEHHLRMEECLTFMVANKSDTTEPLTPDNAYVLTIDSRSGQKKAMLSTNKNRGESVAYSIQLDIENSNFTLTDSEGNLFTLKSLAKLFDLHNANGDQFKLEPDAVTVNTKVYTVNAPSIVLNGDTLNTGTLDVSKATTLHNELQVFMNATVIGMVTANGVVSTSTVTASGFIDPTGVGVWHKH